MWLSSETLLKYNYLFFSGGFQSGLFFLSFLRFEEDGMGGYFLCVPPPPLLPGSPEATTCRLVSPCRLGSLARLSSNNKGGFYCLTDVLLKKVYLHAFAQQHTLAWLGIDNHVFFHPHSTFTHVQSQHLHKAISSSLFSRKKNAEKCSSKPPTSSATLMQCRCCS
jgi:hypothetical protein